MQQRIPFEILGATMANRPVASLAVAVARAGHTGLLDLEFADPATPAALVEIKALAALAAGHVWGIKLREADVPALLAHAAAVDALSGMGMAVLVGPVVAAEGSCAGLADIVRALRAAAPRARIFAELRDDGGLPAAEAAGVDGLVAKGHEAGGHVGDETAFLLTQRLVAATRLPVVAQGGVAPDTAAALCAAGAAGVLLDWQLCLFEAAQVPEALARAVARMDGSETLVLGGELGAAVRVFWRADHKPAQTLAEADGPGRDPAAFLAALRRSVAPWSPEASLWLMGQDAAFAGRLRDGHRRIGAALDALRDGAVSRIVLARDLAPLAEDAPLAQALGTRYPIVQGPMTRVSDRADFALAVAEGGALPFLALALMRRPEAEALVAETKAKMGARPWGVGILGFVDDALREEQTAVIVEHRPDFALIAGGRPDQALALERQGIPTFLHVPSPGLLKLFLQSGARRFIFEGRECGGHVGPRSSAILWQQAIDALNDHFPAGERMDCDLLFAGGIHDARSGAMVSALAAGLAARGARVGVLVGTGYILTREAVETGAIVPAYQSLVLGASQTVLLESGPGHATRVVASPIVGEFLAEKARLRGEGVSAEQARDRLERFNVGRSRIAAKGLDRNPAFGRVPGAEKLVALGVDDQMRLGLYMIGQAAALHDAPTTIAALHTAISVGASEVLTAALSAKEATVAGPDPEGVGARIAITGMGTLLPKAQDLAAYWENILDQVDVVEEVPERRWDWRRYYDPDRNAADRIYSKWGGFLDEIPFDPIRYGIPPKSMPSIEPLQLLALETVRQALENAGFPEGRIEDADLRRRTSVIIGVGGGAGPLGQRYAVRAAMPAVAGGEAGALDGPASERLPDWTEDSFPGILLNVIAGRVANRFDLGGVNFTVDAACGSSLAAVMLAVRELETGTSDMVIVGGADSFQNPFDFVAFSKTRALSPRGRCRTFDASADGIAISEGVAMIVLRRLQDAEAAGDRIYAVIRGVAGSSDGRDLSLTAPRAEGQQEALRRAYARAGISPGTIGLVEAHGTGTVVGDRTEIESLSAVFAAARGDRQFCGVGSVKSMIGHTKAAAGSAGLIKMALALHHRVLPPTLNVETPSPTARFPESPFYVQTETRPWLRDGDRPRRAGVSAFGFGGTNFHAVLEEYEGGYLPFHQEPFRRNWDRELYLFSAPDRTALAMTVARAAAALEAAPKGLRAADVAASLAAQFDASASARLALVAPGLSEAAGCMARAAAALQMPDAAETLRVLDPMGTYFSGEAPLRPDQVAFLFPGQGSQYPGMAADLTMTFPALRARLETATAVLAGRTPAPLGSLIHPRPTFDAVEADAQAAALRRTDVAQPAIGAVSLAVLDLLRDLGLEAGAFAGHSFGEYTALHAAGAFDAETLLRLAHARGDAIMRAGGDDLGAMLAVSAGAQAVRAALPDGSGLTLANLNAPDQTVLAGPTSAIEAAASALSAAGFAAQRLPVACGFHSDCVAPARDLLASALAAAAIAAPVLPVFANATAAPYPSTPDAVRAQLAAHLTDPVNFLGMVEAMHVAGARLFVEVGPGAILSRLANRCLGDLPHLAVATDVKGRGGLQQLLTALAAASAAGLPLRLDRLWNRRAAPTVDVQGWKLASQEGPRRATLWMIDAANARPIDGVPPRRGFAARIEEDAATVPLTDHASAHLSAPATAAPVSHAQATSATEVPPVEVRSVSPTPAPPMPPRPDVGAVPEIGEVAAILRRHQEMMGRFLDHNRDVMLAWLGAGGAASAPAGVQTAAAVPFAGLPTGVDTAPSPGALAPYPPSAAEQQASPPSAPQPAADSAATPTAAAPALTVASVTAALLDLIADRTGYPPEMLGEELDLEADLGVDSIKRVEVLGALRLRLLSAVAEQAHELMGPVARERTVRGIVARFLEVAAACATGAGAGATGPGATGPAPAATPTAAAPALTVASVTAALLDLIADRTGYPPEMLGEELDLEADLGVDSIKRVEVLGALRLRLLSAVAEQAHELMGPVARERTVRGIVARFLEVAAACATGAGAGDMSSGPVSAAAPGLSLIPGGASLPDGLRMDEWGARFVMVPRAVAATPARPWVVHDTAYVITDDGVGLADALASAIAAAGGRPILLSAADLAASPADAGLRARLATLTKAASAPVAGLIHLAPLAPAPTIEQLDAAGWDGEVGRCTRSFHTLLSALGPALSQRADGVVLCATELGGAFGFDGQMLGNPAAAGAPGLLKTLAGEWPTVRCRAVDFDAAADLSSRLAALMEEAGRDGGEVEIGRPADGRRLVLLAERRPLLPDAPALFASDPGAVVLVTGGARGITARVTRAMAAQAPAHFVLVGSTRMPEDDERADTAALTDPREIKASLISRAQGIGVRPAPAAIEEEYRALMKTREIRAALNAVTEAGGTAEYLACDVRDPAAFGALIEDVYARHGRIDGMLHGAGVIEDKLVLDKTPDSFDRVVRTKTDSAFTLMRTLRPEGLRFLVFFTSVAGRFGNRGQGDYGAANETVSKLARRLAAKWPSTRVVAISWGPWDAGGMVSPEVRAQFDRLGIEPIDPRLGEQAFWLEVTRGANEEPEVVWGRGPWENDAARLASRDGAPLPRAAAE